MKKDIRSLISEAFDELYQEMVNEAPQTSAKSAIEAGEINSYVNNAIQKGAKVPYNFAKEDKKSKENFDIIIDTLIDNYKITKNPKIKQAIQATYYPEINSKLYRAIGSTFLNNPDMEDAASAAYEQILINNFDANIDSYQTGSRGFGGMVTDLMKRRIYDYIVRGSRGATGGGSRLDALTGWEGKPLSLDTPIGGEEGGDDWGSRVGDAENAGEEVAPDTLGGQIAATLGGGAQTAMEKGFEKEDKIKTQREILNDVISWLDNTFDENSDEMGKRRMVAFKGLVSGDSPDEIFEENPGVFASPARVSEEFGRLINGKEAQEISKIISNIYGINFNLANIDPKKLKQTSSMKPEFGGFSKIVKISTPEMQDAQQELNKALAAVGLKSTDFNSESKKSKVMGDLQTQGKEVELEAILDADDYLASVTEKAKAQGKFDTKTALLPSTPEEEAEAGMFESFKGFSMEALMERVYKRLTK
ncbi:MAG: hypothetical protein AABY15_05645 [Nanoarchaeota archaeon]